MRTLLIDNYDSYTYNLYQIIAEVNGEPPLVFYNDEITLEQILSMVHAGTVHSIVISPGPGTPLNVHDVGVCMDVLQHLPTVPVLGICLGHQALAAVHGAAVVSAPEPVHGRLSRLGHSGHPLFKDVPRGGDFQVVRYHSLLVDEASLPPCLEPICWTEGGHIAVCLARDRGPDQGPEQEQGQGQGTSAGQESQEPGSHASATEDHQHQHHQQAVQDRVASHAQAGPGPAGEVAGGVGGGVGRLLMGIAHRHRPHYGVQFHPESVATRYGIALLRNFRDLAAAAWRAGGVAPQGVEPPAEVHRPVPDIVGPPGRLPPSLPAWPPAEHQAGAPLRLAWERLGGGVLEALGGSQGVFELLYGWGQDTFWLDSAATDRGRFSYMGGRGGPLWRKLTYRLPPPRGSDPHQGSPADQQPLHHDQPAQATPTEPHGPTPEPQDDGTGSSAASSSCGDGPDAATSTAAASSSICGGPNAPSISLPPSAAAIRGTLTIECLAAPASSNHHTASVNAAAPAHQRETVAVVRHTGLLEYLQRLMAVQRLRVDPGDAAALPFNFWGGLVGYLGYELKAECGCALMHTATTPDAVLYVADRLVAVDHHEGQLYLLAMYDSTGGSAGPLDGGEEEQAEKAGQRAAEAESEARKWLQDTRRRLEEAAAAFGSQHQQQSCSQAGAQSHAAGSGNGHGATSGQPPTAGAGCGSCSGPAGQRPVVPFALAHSRPAYLRNIQACHAALHAGESYEVCLTTALTRGSAPSPSQLYGTLRRLNPAPYAAWLQCGPQGPTICCSSPERFLRGDRGGLLEARPIKGTAARRPADPAADAAAAAALAASEKERAENLMIVDLLRNDLGRVCEVGTVHVPGLMDIESYATVHQMVSTVRGLRRAGVSSVDCVRAAFPGGSMTGAPKVRTCAIIDTLEGRARGVYSGCIGFLSFNDTFDLNIVIRTAVIEHNQTPNPAATNGTPHTSSSGGSGQDGAGMTMSIGAGGAIVVQSELAAEYDEMRLKASALLRAVGLCEGLGGAQVPVEEAEGEQGQQGVQC